MQLESDLNSERAWFCSNLDQLVSLVMDDHSILDLVSKKEKKYLMLIFLNLKSLLLTIYDINLHIQFKCIIIQPNTHSNIV